MHNLMTTSFEILKSLAAVYYTPEILKGAGWNESQVLVGTIYVGVCKLGGEILAFFLLDRLGRR